MEQVVCDIYTRVSSDDQAENGYSLGEQEERLRQFATAHGWIIHKVHPDGGYSGGNINRPALQEVITDAKRHRINKVIVYKLDRLSRSQKDTLFLIEEVFLPNGVDFVSMTESFDTSTPFGMAMVGILSVFAQLERANIKERMTLGRDARVKSGKPFTHCNHTIGFKYENGKLVLDPYDANVVRKMFEDYAHGKSLSQIARELSRANWRNRSWQAANIKRIMEQPLYIGEQRWKGETVPVLDCPRIVSDELYAQVQREMARRHGEYAHTESHTALLNGMIWCGRCGKRYGSTNTRYNGKIVFRYYCNSVRSVRRNKVNDNCHNRGWREDELESIVLEQVERLAVNIDDMGALESAREQEYIENCNALQSRLRALEKQNEKLVELFTLGAIDPDTIKKRGEVIRKERENIEDMIEELKKPTGELPVDELKKQLQLFKTAVNDADKEQLRTVLHQLIKAITLTDDDVKIEWNFKR